MEDNQELYDLKAKVNKIEYTEIKELKEEIQQVKKLTLTQTIF